MIRHLDRADIDGDEVGIHWEVHDVDRRQGQTDFTDQQWMDIGRILLKSYLRSKDRDPNFYTFNEQSQSDITMRSTKFSAIGRPDK